MVDDFPTDGSVCGGLGDGSGSNGSDGERQMKLRSPAAHFLLCGPVPNSPRHGSRGFKSVLRITSLTVITGVFDPSAH